MVLQKVQTIPPATEITAEDGARLSAIFDDCLRNGILILPRTSVFPKRV